MRERSKAAMLAGSLVMMAAQLCHFIIPWNIGNWNCSYVPAVDASLSLFRIPLVERAETTLPSRTPFVRQTMSSFGICSITLTASMA
jgi:hypothetical protein